MQNRHHIISALLLVVVMSVFLSSCGIPSVDEYISMENISILPTTSNSDIILKFQMSSDNDEISRINKGPSLLLTYAIGQGTADTAITGSDRDGLVNSLNSYLEKNKIYNGENKPIVTYNSINMYSFQRLEENEFTFVENPLYSFEMGKIRTDANYFENYGYDYYSYVNNQLKLRISQEESYITEEGYKGYYYSVAYDGSSEDEQLLMINPMGKIPEGSRIYLFAAIAPGSGNFSFPSWSKAKFIGSFQINN